MQGNRGKNLELNIEQANAFYKLQGVAEVQKKPTPMKIIGTLKTPGMFKTVFEKKSTVDFEGVIGGGISVQFDAKETKTNTMPLHMEDKLHTHQREYLGRCHRLGAICFLVVEFTSLKESYVVPWPVVAEQIKKAESLPKGARGKGLHVEECRRRDDIFKISTKKGFLDYLEPVIEGRFGVL